MAQMALGEAVMGQVGHVDILRGHIGNDFCAVVHIAGLQPDKNMGFTARGKAVIKFGHGALAKGADEIQKGACLLRNRGGK